MLTFKKEAFILKGDPQLFNCIVVGGEKKEQMFVLIEGKLVEGSSQTVSVEPRIILTSFVTSLSPPLSSFKL